MQLGVNEGSKNFERTQAAMADLEKTPKDELRIRPTAYNAGATLAATAPKRMLLTLLAEGKTLVQCQEVLNRSQFTLLKWVNEPGFREQLKEVSDQAFSELMGELKVKARNTRDRLDAAADAALDKVLELMEGADSEVVQMRCAMDVLDRVKDTSKITRIDKRTINANISVPEEWLKAAAQVDIEEGPVVDVAS